MADHVAHAEGLAVGWAGPIPKRGLDLGSGAGVPGLPLALAWPTSRWVLLDANRGRGAALGAARRALALTERVVVAVGRAEELARSPDLRGGFELVVARSFGPPAVTAECGAPFLVVGGLLAVSEPPGSENRWPAAGLDTLGLVPEGLVGDVPGGGSWRLLRQAMPCAERFPRRTGVPAKRPLF